jgi:hypothetical protein
MLEMLWNNQLLQLLYTSVGIQWVGWAVSAYFHTEKFYDLTGASEAVVCSLCAVTSRFTLAFAL